ncbi:MAG: tRNA (guanosine(37)-N1)-methyltransferase TrmD [Actinomycetota bacterium]|nr:tRNA (guanosine(37)-N1)-methyltransferase TrmD [Actinomycetota bacterium]
MEIDLVTLFPNFFEAPLKISLIGKAIEAGRLSVEAHDLRRWGLGKHLSVDDEPYGGGAGMVMRPEPLFEAIDSLRRADSHVVLLSARGQRLTQEMVVELASFDHLVLVCGRYEGVDERVAQFAVDREVSIGDYVVAGGEVAALVVIEAVGRLAPGVLGNVRSLDQESFTTGLLEYPQYTRPVEYRGHRVPDVLLSGNHPAIAEWRSQQSEEITKKRRPDLAGGTQ